MISISRDVFEHHIDYAAWANARLVDAAARLSDEELTRDFGTSDKSVLGTLVHVFGADRVWLARLKGQPSLWLTDDDYRLSVLQTDWPALYDEWRKWLSTLDDDPSRQMFTFKDMKGNEWTQPLWELVLHVVNHGTHHRGQVSGFLRALGKAPPQLDMTAFDRERAATR
jgi:uncharacterized damage-inducible protein DinB